MRYRQAALTVVAFLLCALTGEAQTSESVTEQQIVGVVNSIDRAARRKNIAGMMAPLADDVKIRMTVTVKNYEPKVLTLTKEQYVFQTKQAFKVRFKYTLARKNIKVKVYDGGKTGMVTSDLYETLSMSGVLMRMTTSEVAYMTQRDGKLLVTSIETNSHIY